MVRYPRLGGRRATRKILDVTILRRSRPYLLPRGESAKFRCGPRNTAINRERSLRMFWAVFDGRSCGCQILPSPRSPLCHSFRRILGCSRSDLPPDFPLLPMPPLFPYTRRRSCVFVRTSPENRFRPRRRCELGLGPEQRLFSTPCGQVCGQETEKEAGHFRWQNQTRPPWSGRRSISRFAVG